jgi:hypothetical protein
MSGDEEYDYLFKVVLIGDSGVGCDSQFTLHYILHIFICALCIFVLLFFSFLDASYNGGINITNSLINEGIVCVTYQKNNILNINRNKTNLSEF